MEKWRIYIYIYEKTVKICNTITCPLLSRGNCFQAHAAAVRKERAQTCWNAQRQEMDMDQLFAPVVLYGFVGLSVLQCRIHLVTDVASEDIVFLKGCILLRLQPLMLLPLVGGVLASPVFIFCVARL